MNRCIRISIAASVLIAATAVAPGTSAQVSAPPRPTADFKNASSFGLSYGYQNDRDADFWGWSVDYSRTLNSRWFAAAAVTWDRETETFDDRPDTETDSFAAVGTISYGVTSWFSLTTGFGWVVADDDNSAKAMQFTNGDLSTGIVVGFATPRLPWSDRASIALSASYEFNLTQNETAVSFDVSYGWSF